MVPPVTTAWSAVLRGIRVRWKVLATLAAAANAPAASDRWRAGRRRTLAAGLFEGALRFCIRSREEACLPTPRATARAAAFNTEPSNLFNSFNIL
jgi:hypothetical protein